MGGLFAVGGLSVCGPGSVFGVFMACRVGHSYWVLCSFFVMGGCGLVVRVVGVLLKLLSSLLVWWLGRSFVNGCSEVGLRLHVRNSSRGC